MGDRRCAGILLQVVGVLNLPVLNFPIWVSPQVSELAWFDCEQTIRTLTGRTGRIEF